MIATVFRIGLLRLWNNPLEVVLMFGVPIVFFSIFALIFSRGIGSGKSAPIDVVFVDQDLSETTSRLIRRLDEAAGINTSNRTSSWEGEQVVPLAEDKAKEAIRAGDATLAVVFRADFGQQIEDGEAPVVELLADTSDQIATQLVSALVRQEVSMEQGRQAARAAQSAIEKPPGTAVPQSPALTNVVTADGAPPQTAPSAAVPNAAGPNAAGPNAAGPNQPAPGSEAETPVAGEEAAESVPEEDSEPADVVKVHDVLADDIANPQISMYAAGIAVMFLLFSASGAGGTLLEEQEAGTLERLLSSRLSVTQLLVGKWLYIAFCGTLQLLVMFLWAQLIFQVDLVGHLSGFLVMALATSAAAASLALLLATLCRSRNQLNGVSVILILTMSALGGSMVPRYIMSEEMQQWGLMTFNAWALDGFNKVFWRNLPLTSLIPQVGVLLLAAVAMGIFSRIAAQRWES